MSYVLFDEFREELLDFHSIGRAASLLVTWQADKEILSPLCLLLAHASFVTSFFFNAYSLPGLNYTSRF